MFTGTHDKLVDKLVDKRMFTTLLAQLKAKVYNEPKLGIKLL